MADPISPPPEIIAAQNKSLALKNTESSPPQTAEKIRATGDPLAAAGEKSVVAPDSGNWSAAAFIRSEQSRLAEKLSNPGSSAAALQESQEFSAAVAAGGQELTRYIEAHGSQIRSTYEQSCKDAQAVPDKPEGQQAAVDLIVEEADDLKSELGSDTVVEPGAKLEKLADLSNMLTGAAGKDHEGLARLKAWLREKTAQIQQEIARKQQELGIDQDMAAIKSQLSTEDSSSSSPQTEVVLASAAAGESPESFTPQEATRVQQAIESGDEQLLPVGKQSLIERARTLLRFSASQREKQQRLQKAGDWANSAH